MPNPVLPDPALPDPARPNPVRPDPMSPDPMSPDPMSPDPDQRHTGHQSATRRAGARDTQAGRELDSSGRPLALRLPDWDLLPPTEFLQRHRDR